MPSDDNLMTCDIFNFLAALFSAACNSRTKTPEVTETVQNDSSKGGQSPCVSFFNHVAELRGVRKQLIFEQIRVDKPKVLVSAHFTVNATNPNNFILGGQ